MHKTLTALISQLNQLAAVLNTAVPVANAFGQAHGNWMFPGLTRDDLIRETQSVIDFITANASDDLGDEAEVLQDFVGRLVFLQNNTVPQIWSNASAGVPAYLFTLQALRSRLVTALTHDDRAEAVAKLRKLGNRVRQLEAQLTGLEPRTGSLASMVERIESAHDAADQLPADLMSLIEGRKTLENVLRQAGEDASDVRDCLAGATSITLLLKERADQADKVLKDCKTAFAAATSVGLAAAFSERARSLEISILAWVFGLVIALAVGSLFGAQQLHALTALFQKESLSPLLVALNLMLALLSIGAPVWFGWLATKQIGQRFRLAEDYAFKASVSRAYEGFRSEAARFDKDMEARVLASALNRLDEQPLRLVETEAHGSPWHELAASRTVRDALRSVPNFASDIKDQASKALQDIAAAGLNTTKRPASEGKPVMANKDVE